MTLAIRIDLGPRRICRNGHRAGVRWKRCVICVRSYNATYNAELEAKRRAYNAAYGKRVGIKEYRRNKQREYRQSEFVRRAHRTREAQRMLDKRYAFVRLVRKYGLEVIDFAKIYDAQGRKCAGCRDELLLDKRTHIDHCHATGRVRGILCHHCNLVLGQARDSHEILDRLCEYLKVWSKKAEAVYKDGRLVPWEESLDN